MLCKDIWITKSMEEVWDEFGAKEAAMSFMRSLVPIGQYRKEQDSLLARIFGDCVNVTEIPDNECRRLRFELSEFPLEKCHSRLLKERPNKKKLIDDTFDLLYKSFRSLEND